MRRLHAEGGPARFYKGYSARVLIISVNGALFNTAFVAIKEALGKRWAGGDLLA